MGDVVSGRFKPNGIPALAPGPIGDYAMNADSKNASSPHLRHTRLTRVLAHRPAEQRGKRAADPTRVGPLLLAVKQMGGETTEAWRAVLDDLTKRGLRRPQFVIVDGGAGLTSALAAVWNGVPVQRCTVHKHRNLLACAPERLYDEITADYTDMIYAETPQDIADWRKVFIRKWRLRHKAVADSLEEAETPCSRLSRCRSRNGKVPEQQMQLNVCMRSSSGGSRRKPCCPRRTLLRCCSGPCSHPARS